MAHPATGISVAGILQSLQNSIAGIASDNAGIQENSDAINRVLAKEQKLMQSAANDAAVVENAKNAAVMGAQSKVAQFMQSTNFDDVQAQVAAQLSKRWEEMQKLDAVITEKESVSFLDNPIMWVGAQLSAQPDIARYNALVDSYNALESHKLQLDTMVDSTKKAALASMETVTADSAAASARVAGVQFLQQANNAQIKALQNDTATLQLLQAGDEKTLERQLQQRKLITDEEESAMRRNMYNLQMQEARMSIAAKAKQAKESDSQDAFNADMLRMVNNAVSRNNGRQFKSIEELTFFYNNPANKETFDKLLATGRAMDVAASNGGKSAVLLGDSIGDVADTLYKVGGSLKQAPAINAMIKKAYSEAMSGTATVVSEGKPVAIDPKQKGALAAYVNDQAAKKAKQDAKNVTAGGADNIYYPPTVGELIAAVKSEDRLPVLYHKILKGDLKADSVITPQYLFTRAASAVLNGDLKLEEAAQSIKSLSILAVQTNNAVRNYKAIGLPEQKTFTGTLENPGYSLSLGDVRVDGISYSDTINKLAKVVAVSKAAKSMGISTQEAFLMSEQSKYLKGAYERTEGVKQ